MKYLPSPFDIQEIDKGELVLIPKTLVRENKNNNLEFVGVKVKVGSNICVDESPIRYAEGYGTPNLDRPERMGFLAPDNPEVGDRFVVPMTLVRPSHGGQGVKFNGKLVSVVDPHIEVRDGEFMVDKQKKEVESPYR